MIRTLRTNRRAWHAAASAVAVAVVGSVTLSATDSSYLSTVARAQNVVIPPVMRAGLATSSTAYQQSYSITGLTPGTAITKLVTLRNDGTATVPGMVFDVGSASNTLLDSDATNGLFVRIDVCSTMWQQPVAGSTATCGGSVAALLPSTPLATLTASAVDQQLLTGLAALTSPGLDHLRIQFTLPPAAPGSYTSLTSQPRVKIWGAAAPTAPTAVTVAPGEAQLAVSWTAPNTYNLPVTAYTATLSPGGFSCTSASTTCTVTGLTNGVDYTATVTATTSLGTGPASSGIIGNPYPASVMSGSPLTLWLDGADSATMLSSAACTGAATSGGGTIGCWKDKSAQSENFVQATVAGQPAVGTLNGRNAPNFTSPAHGLTSVNASNSYRTVIMAALPKTTGTGYSYLFGQAGADYSVRVGSLTTPFSNPNPQDWVANYTGAALTGWTNGAQGIDPQFDVPAVITAQSGSTNTFSASLSNVFMGRGLLGNMAEVIAFNTVLTPTQRRSVEEYLARKWSIPITPQAPTILLAANADASAVVSWTAPGFNGGSTITGYTATALPGGQTCTTTGATTCTIANLANAQAYTVTVSATNSAGTGASSASLPVTPAGTPGAPTGVAATPASGALTVAWTAPTSTGGSAISGYTATANPGGFTCATTGAVSCTISGLTNGTSYTLTVTATNANGTGAASAGVAVTAGTSPSTPGAPTALLLTAGDATITASWSPPPVNGGSAITGYSVTASPSGQTCSTAGGTTCTVNGLGNGVTQTVTVRATNTVGTGPTSAPVKTTPYPASVMTSAAGFSLWLDGADPSTILASSGCTGASAALYATFGCWKDKSGVGEDFIQPTSANRPATGTLNSLPALNMTSTTQYLTSINAADTYQTLFVVTLPKRGVSNWNYLFGQAGADFNLRLDTNNPIANPNADDWATGTGSPPNAFSNGRRAIDPVFGAPTVVLAQSATPKTFSASVSNSFLNRGTTGTVAEVLAFSGALTTAQRRIVEDYLSVKWGIAITADAAGTPTATVATTTSITATWTAPTYNGGTPVTSYTATVSPGGQTCSTTGALTCTVTGLTHSTSYTVTVRANNAVGVGVTSAASATVTP